MEDASELSYEQLKPFKCPKCPNSFVTKHFLKLHTKVIHSKGIFECRKCDFRCDKIGNMNFHTQRHLHNERHSKPPDESPSKIIKECETQAKVPSLILKLGKHKLNISQNSVLESQNDNDNIPNNNLDSDFIGEKHLSIDKTTNKSTGNFICKICKKKFTQRVRFQKHMMIKHTEMKSISVGSKVDGEHIRCLLCHKLFSSKGTLKRHMLIHTGEMPFECTKCDSKFNQNIQLQQHVMKYHGEGMFKCNKCDESFIQSIHLQRHMAAHTGKKPFSCKKCDASFAMNRDLKRHLTLGHIQNKPFQCRKRGNKLLLKRFVSKSKKKNRTTININITVNNSKKDNSEKYLKCMKCKETVKFSQLRSHMDSHQNAFRCVNCNRIFLTQHSLKIHIAKAHKEKSVNTELDLEHDYENSKGEENAGNQSRVEIDQNDFRCEICDRNCHSLRSLNIHKSKAHKNYIDKIEKGYKNTLNEKPEDDKSHNAIDMNDLRCEICGKICNTLHGLKIHKIKAHKKSSDKKIDMLSERKSEIDKDYTENMELMIASQKGNSDVDNMKIDDKTWRIKSCEEGGKLKIKLQTNSRES